MDDKLKILIQAVLDETISAKNINTQLKKMQIDSFVVSAKLDSASIKSQVSEINKSLADVSVGGGSIELNRLSAYFERLERQSASFATTSKKTFSSVPIKEYIDNMTKTSDVQKEMSAYYKQLEKDSNSYVKSEQKRQLLLSQGTSFFQTNTKAVKKYATEWANVQDTIKNGSIDDATYQLKTLMSTVKANGDLGRTFFGGMTEEAKKFAKWTLATGSVTLLLTSLNKMVSNVKSIDLATTELKKVTDETDVSYERFLTRATSNAQKLGSTISDLVNSTADFARLGYSLEDAETLGQVAVLYKNVGD